MADLIGNLLEDYVPVVKFGGIRTNKDISTSGVFTNYSGAATAGQGIVAIRAKGRSEGQIGAVSNVTSYTVGSSDGSFIVSANVIATSSTSFSFTVNFDYTDETNTSRTQVLTFMRLSGAIFGTIANGLGTEPHNGIPCHIRAKAGTTITVYTTGTFTTVVYNVEGVITQID